jgi:hypothetical protein
MHIKIMQIALPGIDIPEPVFFCSLEAESQSDQV